MFQDAIAEFWEWWESERVEIDRELTEGGLTEDLIREIDDLIWRVHPELNWQITAGLEAPRSFNLVSGGTRLLRLIAELWRRMGPPDDELWEHHSARLPFGLTSFDIDDVPIDPAEARFESAPDRLYERLDITIGHPAFFDLTEDQANEAAMHLLDAALGEDGVERWLGILSTVDDLPDGSPIFTILGSIEQLAESATGQGWEQVDDQYDGVVEARVNRAVKWIDHLDKPIYAEITTTALAVEEDGLPAPLEKKRLESLSADLIERLGDRAVVLGGATGDGEQTLHLYVQPHEEVEAAILAWQEDNANREINVELVPDEQWQNAEQWD